MKNRFFPFGLLSLLLSVLAFSLCACGEAFCVRSFDSMGAFMTVRCYGENAEDACRAIEETVRTVEKEISVTIPGSTVSSINSAADFPVKIGGTTKELLVFSLHVAEITDGAFNPALFPVSSAWGFPTGEYSVPAGDEIRRLLELTDFRNIRIDGANLYMERGMKLDFGAVGKGFAGDCAAGRLAEFGVASAVLDLGGNICVIGKKPDGSDWRIGIKSPWDDGVAAAVSVHDCSVVTSGGYERFFVADGKTYVHIIDGATGFPVENEILSATVVCRSGAYADALSTAVFVLGTERAVALWQARRDFEMILMCRGDSVLYTPGLTGSLSFIHDFKIVEIAEE